MMRCSFKQDYDEHYHVFLSSSIRCIFTSIIMHKIVAYAWSMSNNTSAADSRENKAIHPFVLILIVLHVIRLLFQTATALAAL